MALSPAVYGADDWQQRLRKAWAGASADVHGKKELEHAVRIDRQLEPPLRRRRHRRRRLQVLERRRSAKTSRRPTAPDLPPPAAITDAMLLGQAGRGRRPNSRPISAASTSPTATCIASAAKAARKPGRSAAARWPTSPRRGRSASSRSTGTKKFLGHGGQTSTQIVLLTKPPQSWTLLPLGESDRPRQPALRRPGRALVQQGHDEADLLSRQGRTDQARRVEDGRVSRRRLSQTRCSDHELPRINHPYS